MAKPLAVVISDLHLGEQTSVLHYEADVGPHPVVQHLLARVKEAAGGTSIPFLVLAGDTFDFSLAPVQDGIADFRRFLADVHEHFENFILIPGNHDHHVWTILQEQVYVLNQIKDGDPPRDLPQEQVGSIEGGRLSLRGVEPDGGFGTKTFLNDLLPAAGKDKGFALVYPNLYIRCGSRGDANILITHGHFFEATWTFVSDVFQKSLGLALMDYRRLERINAPFTEFGWYGLGQAGELSRFVRDLYHEAKNAGDTRLSALLQDARDYADRLWTLNPQKGKGLASRLLYPFRALGSGLHEASTDQILDGLMLLIKHLVADQLRGRGSHTPGAPLRHVPHILDDPERAAKVRTYISYSLDRPYDFQPARLVFGHTHVPMAEGRIGLEVDGRQHEVAVQNTGGWVVDSDDRALIARSRPAPVLIDGDGAVTPVEIAWFEEQDLKNNPQNPQAEAIRIIREKASSASGRRTSRKKASGIAEGKGRIKE